MIKRVNSTGRRRISSERAVIEVLDGDPRSFNAEIDLSEFDAPDDAVVVLEATCAGSNTICRFEWGTVSKLSPPVDRNLQDLHGKNVFFSLKVIDRTEKFGRILGLAQNIRPLKAGPKTATGRQGILPVEATDLGDELWKLDFRTEDVFLLVNNRVTGLADRVRFDPAIFSLIYPAIVRDILRRALDEAVDEDDDSDRWPTLWLKFGENLHPEGSSPPEGGDEDDLNDWVEEIVTAFCNQHELREKFAQYAGASDSWEDFA